jgi:hypothetical protein
MKVDQFENAKKTRKKQNKHFSVLQTKLVMTIIEWKKENKKEVGKTMWEAFQNQECLIQFNLGQNFKQKMLEWKKILIHFFTHV